MGHIQLTFSTDDTTKLNSTDCVCFQCVRKMKSFFMLDVRCAFFSFLLSLRSFFCFVIYEFMLYGHVILWVTGLAYVNDCLLRNCDFALMRCNTHCCDIQETSRNRFFKEWSTNLPSSQAKIVFGSLSVVPDYPLPFLLCSFSYMYCDFDMYVCILYTLNVFSSGDTITTICFCEIKRKRKTYTQREVNKNNIAHTNFSRKN